MVALGNNTTKVNPSHMRDTQRAPRAVTAEEAAAYVGCSSVRQFQREISQGIWPGPITINSRPQRWSIPQLDRALEGEHQQQHGDIKTRAIERLDKKYGLLPS